LDDLIVGAWRFSGVNNQYGLPGKSYVIFGKTDGTAINLSAIASGTGGFGITGVDWDSHSGYSVSTAGDVNGDGLDDLKSSKPSPLTSPAGSGASASNAGDVSGDGLDDLIVGARIIAVDIACSGD
jgi:hypothetical protein